MTGKGCWFRIRVRPRYTFWGPREDDHGTDRSRYWGYIRRWRFCVPLARGAVPRVK